MAWQQKQGGYDNYGGYVDPASGANYQQHQGQTTGMYATGQPTDQAAYDMFSGDEGTNFNTTTYNTQSNSGMGTSEYSGATAMPSTGYYNPTAQSGQSSNPQQNVYGNTQQTPNLASVAGGMFGGSAQQLMSNPVVTDMVGQYVGKGQEEIKKNIEQYISIGQLKYYFAVDTNYVGRKLGILLFPFAQKDWTVKYNEDQPVQPKYDLNAPDLYIPCMGYITYILVVGYILGLKDHFSPDNLAATASSSLVWLILELVLVYLTLTVMSINTSMTKWDILSYSCYKYVGVIVVLLTGLALHSTLAYYISLSYVSAAMFFFLLRTLKLRIEPEVHGLEVHAKRKLYMMLMYAGLQPAFMWWLTYHLVPLSPVVSPPEV